MAPSYFTASPERHHHPAPHSVDGVRGQASADGDTPPQQEGRQEVTLQGSKRQELSLRKQNKGYARPPPLLCRFKSFKHCTQEKETHHVVEAVCILSLPLKRLGACTDPGDSSIARGTVPHLQGADQDDRLEGVVHAEVETAVHDNAHAGDGEATVQAGDTVSGDGLAVHINEAVESGARPHPSWKTWHRWRDGYGRQSREYTNSSEAAPAAPPEARLPANHFQ